MCEDDDLTEIAQNFCKDHKLNQKQAEEIVVKIKEAIKKEKDETPRVPEEDQKEPDISENVEEEELEAPISRPVSERGSDINPSASNKVMPKEKDLESWEITVAQKLRERALKTFGTERKCLTAHKKTKSELPGTKKMLTPAQSGGIDINFSFYEQHSHHQRR